MNSYVSGQCGRVVKAWDFGAKVTGFNCPTLPHWYANGNSTHIPPLHQTEMDIE